jgi:hypothetical protein
MCWLHTALVLSENLSPALQSPFSHSCSVAAPESTPSNSTTRNARRTDVTSSYAYLRDIQSRNLRNGNGIRVSRSHLDLIAGADLPLPHHREVETGTAAREESLHHAVVLKSNTQFVGAAASQ